MIATFCPTSSCDDDCWTIHPQPGNSSTSNRTQAVHSCCAVNPRKMLCPDVYARVEQCNTLSRFRINAHCNLVFAAVAVPARETQVLQDVAVLRVNMIDLHCLSNVCFACLTVFAIAIGPFIDKLLESIPG